MKCFDDIATMFGNKYGTNMVNRLIEADGERGRATVNHGIGRWRRFLDMDIQRLCTKRHDKHTYKHQTKYPVSSRNHGFVLPSAPDRSAPSAYTPLMIFIACGNPLVTLGLSYSG